MNKIFFLLFFASLIGLAVFMLQPASGNQEKSDKAKVAWREFLDRIPANATLENVCDMLRGSARLIGNQPLGGTGARTFFFEIDPILWLEIDFDGSDVVSSTRLVKARSNWRRFPDGTVFFE